MHWIARRSKLVGGCWSRISTADIALGGRSVRLAHLPDRTQHRGSPSSRLARPSAVSTGPRILLPLEGPARPTRALRPPVAIGDAGINGEPQAPPPVRVVASTRAFVLELLDGRVDPAGARLPRPTAARGDRLDHLVPVRPTPRRCEARRGYRGVYVAAPRPKKTAPGGGEAERARPSTAVILLGPRGGRGPAPSRPTAPTAGRRGAGADAARSLRTRCCAGSFRSPS